MDTDAFATDPSSPSWEVPRSFDAYTMIYPSEGRTVSTTAEIPGLRAKILSEASNELERMCKEDVPLESLQTFLSGWETSSGSVQPNALAWFNYSNPVGTTVRNGRKDLTRLLLARGLKPDDGIGEALAKIREDGDNTMLEILIEGGWDINAPVSNHTPSVMR